MMISCDNAPALENALHRKLYHNRVNRVNVRKEYFRTDFDSIKKAIVEEYGEADYVLEPEALQFRDSELMTGDDSEFVEGIMESLTKETDQPGEV